MSNVPIEVRDVTLSYGNYVIMEDISFKVNSGDIFIIMGASGSGKSTLLKVMTGLKKPACGDVLIYGGNFWVADEEDRKAIMKGNGILYQNGALFSSMTLSENIALPLQQYTSYSQKEIGDLVSLKLALVGLSGFEDFYPSELSGGMKKRAGLARALALDPKILYFDEPSAGLDPVSSKLLDDLIKEVSNSLGTTIVIVTHELDSIFSIGTNSIFLDADSRTVIGQGNPKDLLKNPPNDKVLHFLTRGQKGNG